MKIAASAKKSNSRLLVDVFTESRYLVFTTIGYNTMFHDAHWKNYKDCEVLCTAFIREARLSQATNPILEEEINYMCCAEHCSLLHFNVLHLAWCVQVAC